MVKTIDTQMMETNHHPSGFNYLRFILSLFIMVWHTIQVCLGLDVGVIVWNSVAGRIFYFLVPCFFSLSGFLVAGSLARCKNIPEFLTLPVLRLLPALCCEVCISALLIGSLLTELPINEYYSSSAFYAYFLNIVGDVHYSLPGLFNHNILASIANAQLWTIPYEMKCYILIVILAFTGIVRYQIFLGIVAIFISLFAHYDDARSGEIYLPLYSHYNLTIPCFVWGIFIYVCKQKIPYNKPLCLCALGVALWAFANRQTVYFSALPIAYFTVYMGLMNPKKIFLVSPGDYSYGLYLYSLPIQQVVYQIFPAFRAWYLHFPLSLFLSGICAYLSWTFVESKFLTLRRPAIVYVNKIYASLRKTLAQKEST